MQVAWAGQSFHRRCTMVCNESRSSVLGLMPGSSCKHLRVTVALTCLSGPQGGAGLRLSEAEERRDKLQDEVHYSAREDV